MNKPYKGEITNWKRRYYPDGDYCIVGIPHRHPQFKDWIITSPVIKFNMKPFSGKLYCVIEIDTKNSRYDLIGEEQKDEIPCPIKNYKKHGY